MQTSLKSRGFYDGTADGIYGYNTKKGLQQFLRDKGFYQGEVDGLLGKSSRDAIKQFQKSVELKTTGRINLETGNAMQRQNIEQPNLSVSNYDRIRCQQLLLYHQTFMPIC